jgi:PAS domain-containing protein
LDRYVFANMVPPPTGSGLDSFQNWHQDRTMHAHDYPVAETPDFLLAVLERASDAVVIADSDLRVSHFNAAAELIWELDRAEVLGCHVSRLGLNDLQASEHDAQAHRIGLWSVREACRQMSDLSCNSLI